MRRGKGCSGLTAARGKWGPSLAPRPAADRFVATRIRRAVGAASRIIVTGHARPDGDCIGSEVALCSILCAAGFRAEVVLADPAPEKYRFLLEPSGGRGREGRTGRLPVRVVRRDEKLVADLAFVLDATGLPRLGGVHPPLQRSAARVINLDHHPGNLQFGDINWVDTHAAATGELVWRLAACCAWPVPPAALRALYVAIMTDTGQFAYSNTSPRVLRMAADLLERGVAPEAVWRRVYLNKSWNELKLDARARASLRSTAGGRIACISLRHEDFAATGTGPEDTDEMASIPRALAGVELALFFYAINRGKRTKVSMRAAPHLDVGALARQFGGGGHKQAAACELDVPLPQARKLFLHAAERFLTHTKRAADWRPPAPDQ
ncbi:MAG: bifunctional oligoribonuclease/PAP phosphatase NrnA [Planctomycetota bacterium]|nr:bifunctional oligoribonuclease/PAP phosphatase NrnA [Planctomycetota bacterium]